MKLNEVMGDYIPYEESTPMQLAKELYRGSGGDVDKAKKMADGLAQKIKQHIDSHHEMVSMRRVGQGSRVEKRPPSRDIPGYKEDPSQRSTFSSVA